MEDGSDRQVELLVRVLGELSTRGLTDDRLVDVDEAAKRVDRQIDVRRDARLLLDLLEGALELLAVDLEHGLAEHLDEPTVGVPREVIVVGHARETGDAGIVQTDVEDGLHHAGHGEARTGAHGHQKRVLRIA